MAQMGGGSRARPRSAGTAMIGVTATPRRNRAADTDLAACSLPSRTRAERRARTGDLLQITKALLIREK
jgi:hypothetical protein